jgi:NADH-quinone oxidoreductase subunit L
LYTWLPDAMAPTPVSALIHAATMVTAGIFMITRFYFWFGSDVQNIIAIVGAVTSLVAATIALVQTDIKKVLAYSTVSQLGLMF